MAAATRRKRPIAAPTRLRCVVVEPDLKERLALAPHHAHGVRSVADVHPLDVSVGRLRPVEEQLAVFVVMNEAVRPPYVLTGLQRLWTATQRRRTRPRELTERTRSKKLSFHTIYKQLSARYYGPTVALGLVVPRRIRTVLPYRERRGYVRSCLTERVEDTYGPALERGERIRTVLP